MIEFTAEVVSIVDRFEALVAKTPEKANWMYVQDGRLHPKVMIDIQTAADMKSGQEPDNNRIVLPASAKHSI